MRPGRDGTPFLYHDNYAGPHRAVSKHREGSRSEYSYDSHGRLLTIDHAKSSNGSKLARFFYKYDDSDDIVYKDTYYYDGAGTQWVSADDKGDWYVYDGAHRLVTTYAGVNNGLTAAPTGGQYVAKWGYVYDNLGNRLTKDDQVGSADVVYAYHANTDNCLVEYDTMTWITTVNFDNNGNTLTLYDGALMAYDYTNKLANAINADGTDRAVHRYDAFGRRVAKDVYATGTGWELTDVLHYYHDGIDIVGRLHVVENGDAYLDPIWDRRYTYGPSIDEPLEYRRGSAGTERFYYHEDFLGSIAVLTDSTGALQEGYRYSDWGEVTGYSSARALITVATGGKQNPWTFTGRESEDEAATPGLNYRQRHLHTLLGRFTSTDPLEQSRNAYLYVDGRSTLMRDPTGRTTVDKCHPPARGSVDAQGQIGCNAARFATDFDEWAPGNIEYCGLICCNPETGSLSRTGPIRGVPLAGGGNACYPNKAPCPPGLVPVGAYHSHTKKNKYGPASEQDKNWTKWMAIKYPGFVNYVARKPHQCDRVNSDGSVSQEPY
jgi:RHS repeat-associated protein